MSAVWEACQYFGGDRLRVVLFVISCIAVLFVWRGHWSRRVRCFIIWPSFLLLVVFLNPTVAAKIQKESDANQSVRFFWIIPIVLLISICTAKAVGALRSKRWLLAVPILLLGILLYTDRFQKLRSNWQPTTANWYKIPPVVLKLSDRIMEDDTNLEKRAIVPLPLSLWVRQYQPGIELLYSWQEDATFTPEQRNLFFLFRPEEEAKANGEEYDSTPVNLVKAGRLAAELEYNYIVIPVENEYIGTLESCGYREIYRVDSDAVVTAGPYEAAYILYRLENPAGEVGRE